jgi:hypothetical protein
MRRALRAEKHRRRAGTGPGTTSALDLPMLRRLVTFTFALAVCAVRPAFAGAPQARPLALELEEQAGWVDGRHSGGASLGFTSRVRYGMLTAGGSVQGATILLGSMGSLSAVAGLSVPIGIVRLDALAEVGMNAYADVGSSFLSRDPGASAVLPFAGVRSSALLRIFRNRRGIEIWLGPSFHYASDLGSSSRTYSYRSQGSGWISGDYHDEWVTRTVEVGQSRYSWLAVISTTVPL